MRLPLNQRGISQIILPLFLVSAIALTVYLAQQQTDFLPSAQVATEAPADCKKVTPSTRSVQYKNCQSASENCGTVTPLTQSLREDDKNPNYKFPPNSGPVVAGYPLKESVWNFGDWKLYNMKGPRQSDGDRTTISDGRFDGPDGKSYKEVDDDPVGENREGTKIEYREEGGQAIVVEYAYTKEGTNYQGLPGKTYDSSKSYAFVPTKAGAKCNGAASTGSKATGAACTEGNECKSGVCTNKKCDASGAKAGGAACTEAAECQSGTCSNKKCAGGSRATGAACDQPSDCASNICTANKCVATSTTNTTNNTTTNRTNTTNNTTSNGTTNTTPTASPSPRASSPTASASAPTSSTSPVPSSSVTSVPTSLTKAEITGFSNSYKALAGRLGTASNSGNLKVVSTIAGSELNSIVSGLPTCPDDANVGKCLDDKFRTRFDFAKTAARLTAFYAIFNNVSGLCVKSDFGLNPLITAVSTSNTTGRVNLCTEATAASKVWRVFAGGKFEPILASDTRWPANPTCASLPQDVATHYRSAEKLFSSQSGFTENTLCDGKTSVAPEGNSPPTP